MKDEREGLEDLTSRTRRFALRVIRLFGALPKTTESQILGKQVLRSGTSVGAQYREGKRARSTAEFISKLEGGMQELEETRYWFELLVESECVAQEKMADLINEADELMAILTTIVKNTKSRRS